MNLLRLTLLSCTALAGFTGAAVSAPAVGLAGEKTLVMFDTESLEVTGTVEVEGVQVLHGIDVRPADGMLYGVADGTKIVTIDLETGEASEKSTLSETIPEDADAIVDFNPVAVRQP